MDSNSNNHRTPVVIQSRTVAPVVEDEDFHRTHQLVERTLNEIAKLSPTKQAAVGGITGMAAGYCFAKASKVAAFAVGASILGLALANQSGYIDVHFDRIRDTARHQLGNIHRAAISTLPQPPTTNVDGEEIETFIDQSSHTFSNALKHFAFANLAITSSFIGGFLLGVAFE